MWAPLGSVPGKLEEPMPAGATDMPCESDPKHDINLGVRPREAFVRPSPPGIEPQSRPRTASLASIVAAGTGGPTIR